MSEKVIEVLNRAREQELHAIAQYMIQHYELEDQGFGKLADKIKEIAIVEMRHAESLGERILFLNGVPVVKPTATPKTGEDIPGILRRDIGLEDAAIKMYNDFAKICAEEGDQVSRQLFTELLDAEEDHINDFQIYLDHVEKLGAAYLATLAE